MRSSALFVGLCVIFSIQNICKAHRDEAYFHNANDGFSSKTNWMARIRDNVPLSEIAMPGTHDSGAYKNNIPSVVTQCLSFDQQLRYGIRVFDIRIRHLKNAFVLHHGAYYLGLNFDDFLTSVENFLKSYPSETVLFRFKNEHSSSGNTRSMRATLDSYLQRYRKFLKTTDFNIKLSQARGRYIILPDYNEFYDLGLRYGWFDIQDAYHLSSNWDLYGKWEKVKQHLSKAANGNKNTFYMNYLSGAGGSMPYFVASGHMSPGTGASRLSTGRTTPAFKNSWVDFPRVNCFIGICTIAFEGTNVLTRYNIPKINGRRTVGIIIADFPGETLIGTIIENNRNLRK